MSEERDILKILFKSGLVALVIGLIGYAIMFFFRLWSARYLGSEGFGLFSLAETILGLVTLIAGAGLANGIPRYLPYYRERMEEGLEKGYTKFVIKGSLLISSILGLMLFLFSNFSVFLFNVPDGFSFVIKMIAVAVPFKVMGKVFRKFFLAHENVFYEKISFQLVRNGILFLGLALIWYYGLGYVELAGFLLLSELVELTFDYIIYKLRFEKDYLVNAVYQYRKWFYFSLPLMFVGAFRFLINWTDNLVIGAFLTPAELGVYSVAYSFANFLTFFQGSLSGIFMPLITSEYAKDNLSKVRLLFKKSVGWVFGLTFPAFLIIAFYAEDILVLIYGSEYSGGSVALTILAIATLLEVSAGFSGSFLTMREETNKVFYVKMIVSGLNIFFNLSLVPLIGIEGAALTTGVSYVLENGIFLYLTKEIHRFNFDFLYILKFILSGLPALAISMLLLRIGFNYYVNIGLAGCGFAIVYVIMLFALKTFDQKDKKLFNRVLEHMGLDYWFSFDESL